MTVTFQPVARHIAANVLYIACEKRIAPYKLFTSFCKLFDKRGISYEQAQTRSAYWQSAGIKPKNRKESDICLDLIVVLVLILVFGV